VRGGGQRRAAEYLLSRGADLNWEPDYARGKAELVQGDPGPWHAVPLRKRLPCCYQRSLLARLSRPEGGHKARHERCQEDLADHRLHDRDRPPGVAGRGEVPVAEGS
jgi:hypothetical protein